MGDDDEETGFETSPELRHGDTYPPPVAGSVRIEELDVRVRHRLGRRRTMLVVGAVTLLVLLVFVVYFLLR